MGPKKNHVLIIKAPIVCARISSTEKVAVPGASLPTYMNHRLWLGQVEL